MPDSEVKILQLLFFRKGVKGKRNTTKVIAKDCLWIQDRSSEPCRKIEHCQETLNSCSFKESRLGETQGKKKVVGAKVF